MLDTVSAKLRASAAAALAIVLASTGANMLVQQRLLLHAQAIASAAEAVREVTGMRASLARARRHEQEAIVAAAHVDLMDMRVASWSAAMRDTHQALSQLAANLASQRQSTAETAAVEGLLKQYEAGFQDTQAGIRQGLLADAAIADGTMEEPRQRVEAADQQAAKLAQALVQRTDEARAEMADAAMAARTGSLALLALFAAVCIAGAVAMRRAIIRPLASAAGIARRVAAGDLSEHGVPSRRDEFGVLLASLEDMRGQLGALVADVRGSVDSVATASREIASGNLDLSNRTEHQAASLAAASGAVQRVVDSIVESADGARLASARAGSMFEDAQRDGERVGQVVATMQRIRDATRRIQQIAGLIDGIARQTHMLGLNAAVEASNAGERGRGFAVVASSVRELAERCRTAAADVRTLVADAGAETDAGIEFARQAGDGLAALIGNARAVSESIAAISGAAQAQRDAIEAVSASIAEIDGATQQNAALVEQAAAAAQSLRDQADRLSDSVATFKLVGEPEVASA